MSSLNKDTFLRSLLFYFPTLILFLSVLNEIDLNYLNIEYFSFNFVYILIFYWTLKNANYLGYGSIFISGLINDVVIGTPIGISSFCFLLICAVTAYLRNITITPHFINDWISLLFTILLVNSIQALALDLIFSFEVNYMKYFINTGFTFIFYPLFLFIFDSLERKIKIKKND
ncbi:rod shape-determining protein MreD [Candidatus Pelagibacter sp.]|mgnify:FL=1|jgi:rod shape-determining protein MreD|nr:rod shape-determining protein MreD [Candidatus Pelagibacter sp.]MDA9662058.1 rod shape-determining protein MreD [bacterium]MDA9957008.1 rod shape-determining protein MreD [Candidatus Pelagibacter sp.]|tara:strand:- start:4 stop:522 length:519 start_codon:yes stop_codon:yes gene_type:complete